MTGRKTAISAIPIIVFTLVSMPVLGDDINCQGEFGQVELDGNVVIAAPCRLNGTEVDGDIKIFAGGSLVAIGAVIDGNIKADDADFIDLQNTEVDGNVDLKKLVGDISYIRDSTIDGHVKLKENRSRLRLLRNYIDKNLQVDKNSGGVFIADNVIDGDLKCDKNSPTPEGGNNIVSGKKKDQCSGLQAAPESGESESDDGTGSTGGSGSDGGTGTTGGSGPPPFEVNVGAGGGGPAGPLFIIFLFVVGLIRSPLHVATRNQVIKMRRRVIRPHASGL